MVFVINSYINSRTDYRLDSASATKLLLWTRMFTLLTLALSSSAAVGIGQTFGNAYAGLMICQGQPDEVDTVILNYTISSAHDHGVLNHFWVTGTYTYDRILCRRRGVASAKNIKMLCL